jgi:hypothetical protein
MYYDPIPPIVLGVALLAPSVWYISRRTADADSMAGSFAGLGCLLGAFLVLAGIAMAIIE